MWEFCLISSNKKYINILENKLKLAIKKLNGICTKLEENGQTKLLIACNSEQKCDVVKLLNEEIANLFVINVKESFLVKNLTTLKVSGSNFKLFVKALTYFDKDYDKQLVKRKLNYKDELYLDSFFAFSLFELKNKWSEVCSLTNENSSFLNSEDTFFELLKFLIANLKIKNKVVNVVYENNNYKFLNEKEEELIKTKNNKNDANLILNLITLSPQNINIYSKGNINTDTINLISNLFMGKVNLFN